MFRYSHELTITIVGSRIDEGTDQGKLRKYGGNACRWGSRGRRPRQKGLVVFEEKKCYRFRVDI